MKKFSILLFLATLAVLLTACGGKSSKAAESENKGTADSSFVSEHQDSNKAGQSIPEKETESGQKNSGSTTTEGSSAEGSGNTGNTYDTPESKPDSDADNLPDSSSGYDGNKIVLPQQPV